MGEFSEHVILNANSDKKHAKYQPSLVENKDNDKFIDVKIPYYEGKSYFLITTSRKPESSELDFRWAIWKPKSSNLILRFTELKETVPGSINITVGKDKISTTYIYYDFKSVVLDGGYYYTYDLSKFSAKKLNP